MNLPMQIKDFADETKYQALCQEVLSLAKQLGATQAEVAVLSSIGLDVSVRLGSVETLEFNRDKVIAITVFIGQQSGNASTTDISPESLRSTVEAAVNLAKLTEADPFAGLVAPEDIAKNFPAVDLYHPWSISVEQAIALIIECEQTALAVDKRITNSEGTTLSTSQAYHVYANSHGFMGFYPSSRHSFNCAVIAQDAKGMERDYQYTVSRLPHLLEAAPTVGAQAAQRALARLSAKKLPTQRVPVLFHASVASSFLGHFLGAISGGRLFRKTTFLLDSLQTQIFPEHIHIYERPHIAGALASAPFDSDGVATFNKDIVRDGIVQNYLLSAYSARKLNLPNTGNAGGVHNVFITPGQEDFPALLRKMDRGLVVMELMGQGVNLVTGDYSRGVSGFWVEQGQIQFPVHEITIAGNLKTLFRDLIAVGKDVDTRSNIQTGSLLITEMMLAGV